MLAYLGMPSPASVTYDFETSSTPGFSNGGGNPPYAWTRSAGRTPSRFPGPSAGVGGSGVFYFAEASSRSPGDLFKMNFDTCATAGQIAHAVDFSYHMHGAAMGELRVVDAAGQQRWILRGDQGPEATLRHGEPRVVHQRSLCDVHLRQGERRREKVRGARR